MVHVQRLGSAATEHIDWCGIGTLRDDLGEPLATVVRRLLTAGLKVEALAARTAMPATLVTQLARASEGGLQ